MAIAVSFDNNSLQTYTTSSGHGIIVSDFQHAGKTAKRAQSYALSHANQSIIPFVDYPTKPIEVEGRIIGTSIADCDAQIDLFNSYLVARNGNLDIDYNGSTRRYIATATNIDVNRPQNLTYADFQITFTCTQAFGQDTAYTTLVNASGRTLDTNTDSVTFGGTSPYQLPLITYTLNSFTGAGTQTVTFGNVNTSLNINITRTWSNADILVIDSPNKSVQVNAVETDFTGIFPSYAPGAQGIGYSDTFSVVNYDLNIKYYKRYL